METVRVLFTQVGPKLRALAVSVAPKGATSAVEKTLDESEFDPTASSAPRKLKFVATNKTGEKDNDGTTGSIDVEVPQTDLLSLLPPDVISKLVRWSMCFLFPAPCQLLLLTVCVELQRRQSFVEAQKGGTGSN